MEVGKQKEVNERHTHNELHRQERDIGTEKQGNRETETKT
jgi:hypothetical protein